MNASHLRKVIESVAEASGERDLDHLRLSLLLTLGEVLPVTAAGFDLLKPAGDDSSGVGTFAWPASLAADRDGILSRLAAGETVVLEAAADRPALLGRAVSEEQALLVQLEGTEPEAASILDAFGRLYTNFSALLFESERDRLTGLRNRRSFDAHIERLTESMLTALPMQPRVPDPQRGPLGWWLALFDIDHFKRINDGFGHLYGDEVLLLLSRIVRQVFRGEDRCFRYGGEEFAVLLARNDLGGVAIALERLRHQIEAFSFPQVGQVTVSLGCALLEPRLGPSDVIDRADRALYAAKHRGRNCLVTYDSLGEQAERETQCRVGSVELF
ncbi:MAG TPA: GGDEF domain-containing protein [Solimonas sp.]|nr:GGDEF domain-containing protein [Solimonas sp.]